MKNRKFLPKSGGSPESMFYLVDVEEKDFVYIFNFEDEELELISMEDLKKGYSEVHTLVDENKEPAIIANRIITPDGTLLESQHRHDFVRHLDTVTNDTYMNDGGTAYLRRSQNVVPAEDVSVYETDSFEKKRLHCTWGTRGKNGDEPVRWVPVAKMSNDHLLAVIQTQKQASRVIIDIMKEEYLWRLLHGIKIDD